MIKRIVIGLIVVCVLTGLAAVEQLSLEAAKDLVLEQNLAYKSLQAKVRNLSIPKNQHSSPSSLQLKRVADISAMILKCSFLESILLN